MTNKIYLKNISKFKIIHSDLYKYGSVINNKIDIYCKIHGVFNQRLDVHRNGAGCPKCGNLKRTSNKDIFIKKAIMKHSNKYNYINSIYINSATKLNIECNKCNYSFLQRPGDHISGSGCPKCAGKSINKIDIINNFNKVHNNKYDYIKLNYKNSTTKIEIICPKHGSFWQEPHNHTSGSGCPKCSSSKGEARIQEYLEENNIDYIKEAKLFKNYRFDFFIEEYNLAIEFDGIQHYEAVPFFGGEEAFLKTQERDYIKNQYCIDNNINSLRISYKNIEMVEEILNEEIEYLNILSNKVKK